MCILLTLLSSAVYLLSLTHNSQYHIQVFVKRSKPWKSSIEILRFQKRVVLECFSSIITFPALRTLLGAMKLGDELGKLWPELSSLHNSDLRDIWEYSKCFKICGVRGIEADSDRSFCQPSSFQTKSLATLPCKNLRASHLFLYVLMRVSQIVVVFIRLAREPHHTHHEPQLSWSKNPFVQKVCQQIPSAFCTYCSFPSA